MAVAALVVIVAVPALVAYALERLLLLNALGFFVVVALGTTLLAQRAWLTMSRRSPRRWTLAG